MRRVVVAFLLLTLGCPSDDAPTTPPNREATEEVEIVRPPVLTADAFIPQLDSRLEDVEVYPDRLVFVYSAPPTDAPSVGNVVSGREGGGYLRRILETRFETPTRLEARTEHAQLSDYFEDLAIRVKYRPAPDFVTDAAGRRVDALGAGLTFPSIDVGDACGVSGGSGLDVNVDLDPTFDIDIDVRERKFKLVTGGAIGADLTATVGGASFGCEWTLPADRAPSREWVQVIPVVPPFVWLVITHEIRLSAKLEAEASATAGTVEATAGGSFGFTVGAEYDEGWSQISDVTREGYGRIDATEPGTASVRVKFSPGVAYVGKLYDLAGPEMNLAAFVEGTATASLSCDWSVDVNGGISATLAPKVEVPVWDYVLFEANFSFDLFEGDIYDTAGRFPWCEDAAMPLPDAGVDSGAGGDGGPGGSDGGSADPCNTAGSDCESCNRMEGCGWCGSSGQCVSDSQRGSCGGQWRDDINACQPCTGTDCASCAASGFCVWCPGVGCVNDSIEEDFAMCGPDFAANPGDC